jgi:predicted lipoprotein
MVRKNSSGMSIKVIKYIAGFIVLAIILFNSVYFRNLEEVKTDTSSRKFNPAAYAKEFWDNELMQNLHNAVEINYLLDMLSKEKERAFDSYSNVLGIGNIRYFFVKGQGKIESVNTNDVTLLIGTDSNKNKMTIATEYIFGNAVRDASGLIDINEFSNTMDFNNISDEINKIIKEQVVPPFRTSVAEGGHVEFVGAIELNREHLNLEEIEIIPVHLVLTNNQLL